jgi:hypothetical protein
MTLDMVTSISPNSFSLSKSSRYVSATVCSTAQHSTAQPYAPQR